MPDRPLVLKMIKLFLQFPKVEVNFKKVSTLGISEKTKKKNSLENNKKNFQKCANKIPKKEENS